MTTERDERHGKGHGGHWVGVAVGGALVTALVLVLAFARDTEALRSFARSATSEEAKEVATFLDRCDDEGGVPLVRPETRVRYDTRGAYLPHGRNSVRLGVDDLACVSGSTLVDLGGAPVEGVPG